MFGFITSILPTWILVKDIVLLLLIYIEGRERERERKEGFAALERSFSTFVLVIQQRADVENNRSIYLFMGKKRQKTKELSSVALAEAAAASTEGGETQPPPRKRGRPRKVVVVVTETKELKEEEDILNSTKNDEQHEKQQEESTCTKEEEREEDIQLPKVGEPSRRRARRKSKPRKST